MSLESLLDRPIAFQRAFVSLGAGVTGALLLSQAVYWSRRSTLRGGWFYKTREDWEEETGLTRREQEGARKKLRDLGVLEEKKRGIPCKTYYRINTDSLQTCLHKTAQLGGTKPPNWVAQNRPPITEITTETTADTASAGSPPADEGEMRKAGKAKKPPCPYDEIKDLYHEILPEFPEMRLWSPKRKSQVKARWEHSENTCHLDWWREYFEFVRGQKFLMQAAIEKKRWCDIEFLTNPNKFPKIIEGAYQEGQP